MVLAMSEMTLEEWAGLRREAHNRWILRMGYRPIEGGWAADCSRYTDSPFSPPRAGQWLRVEYGHGPATARFHRFSGDMRWGPAYSGPSLETFCGYATGAIAPGSGKLAVVDVTELGCRNCARMSRA